VAKRKNPIEAVEAIRARIAELQAERRAIGNTPVTPPEAEAAIATYIERMAARYRDNGLVATLAQRGRLDSLNAGHNPEAFACFFFADRIKSQLMHAAEARLADGLAAGQRAQRLQEFDDALLAAEREEETFIQAAEADGLAITRRADADPRAVLGLDN
jgi:hypothetical protein